MWIPQDTADIERAVAADELEETSSFDAKADLPKQGKGLDLAVDVAAMSTDGGCLLYGVDEDENEHLTELAPIKLAGAADRIGQIVASSIAEVPHVTIRTYPTADDAELGYLLVIVPMSPRAPHQVIVKGDHRFYGRGAKGNRILTEADVARLYVRRKSWEVDREQVLNEVMAVAPVPPDDEVGFLHAFVRPVATDDGLLVPALDSFESRAKLQEWLVEILGEGKLSGLFGPNLKSPATLRRHGADAYRLSTIRERDDLASNVVSLADLDVNYDGRAQVFYGRAVTPGTNHNPPRRVIFETAIAGTTEQLFRVMAALYARAGYHGAVDVGLAITNLAGAYSLTASRDWKGYPDPYPTSIYASTLPLAAASELSNAEELVVRLLKRFFQAASGWDNWTPYAEIETD